MPGISKNSVTWAHIGEEEAGQRLDNYLLRICKGVPKSHLYRILRSGEVRVNKKRVDASCRLQVGDEVRIPPMRIAEKPEEARNEVLTGAMMSCDLPILFEDEALLVVDKPAGIAVHGGSGVSFGVIEALRRQRPLAKFLELAHRLDRETSGILLIGKKRSALNQLHDMFREGGRQADKRYMVLVHGRWMEKKRDVRLPLLKYLLDNGERRVRVSEEGKFSHTVFRLLARWESRRENFSLLEAQLKTGRTHQIRVHLRHLGFPVAGDDKYSDSEQCRMMQQLGLKRMFLHAWKMDFPHPLQERRLQLKAPLPDALSGFLEQLAEPLVKEYDDSTF